MQIDGWDGMQDRAAIGPPPYGAETFPTYGYDGGLQRWADIPSSGRTREEWRAIALEMIGRWDAWLDWLDGAPDELFEKED